METESEHTVVPNPEIHDEAQPLNGEGANHDQEEHHLRRKHEDHSVSRKYRMFSNHSSAGDMPRTITSI